MHPEAVTHGDHNFAFAVEIGKVGESIGWLHAHKLIMVTNVAINDIVGRAASELFDTNGKLIFTVKALVGHHVVHGHQGREIIAIITLENGAFCTVLSENFHKF